MTDIIKFFGGLVCLGGFVLGGWSLLVNPQFGMDEFLLAAAIVVSGALLFVVGNAAEELSRLVRNSEEIIRLLKDRS